MTIALDKYFLTDEGVQCNISSLVDSLECSYKDMSLSSYYTGINHGDMPRGLITIMPYVPLELEVPNRD